MTWVFGGLFLNVAVPVCRSYPYSAHRESPMPKHATPSSSPASYHWQTYDNLMRNWTNPNYTENFFLPFWQSYCLYTSHFKYAHKRSCNAFLPYQISDEDIASCPSGPWSAVSFNLKSHRRHLGAHRIKNWSQCIIYVGSCNFCKFDLNHSLSPALPTLPFLCMQWDQEWPLAMTMMLPAPSYLSKIFPKVRSHLQSPKKGGVFF